MMRPEEVDGSKCELLSSFEPPCPFSFPSPSWEDGDGHALSEEGGLFGQVGQSESTYSFASTSTAKEEPIVIAVCVDIVLY